MLKQILDLIYRLFSELWTFFNSILTKIRPFFNANKWSLESRNIGQFTESIGKLSLFLKTFFTESYHFLKFSCPRNFLDFSEISAFPPVCIYSDCICQMQPLDVFYKKSCKNFAIYTGKHLCWIFFLIRLQPWRPATLLKKDSNTSVFLWILLNF